MPSPLSILKQYWQYDHFRPLQEEIIQSILSGKDTIALLPTGGGKSICFQVPGLLQQGVTIVITPLIALMKDQVQHLQQKNIPAVALHSGFTQPEIKEALEQAAGGFYKFLYVSPERLETLLLKDYLPCLNIGLIAVDEAHCISQWGYDFRPAYLRITALRQYLPDVPVLALTASATTQVLIDIQDKLLLKGSHVYRQSFERPNISYSGFNTDSKINKLVEVLTNVNGSSIVYCKSRRLTKEVCHLLQLQNISADYYHGGLLSEERSVKQERWMNNETRVMVSTNAFGMGIDKPDVRTVVHYNVPDCIENYYQEAGRAGRDNKKAYAVLLYRDEDFASLKELPEIRYPAMPLIKKVYQALADYLQIPVGIGEFNYYDFNIGGFAKSFSLDPILVINVLKVLEQEELLQFNENIFLPARVQFTTPKELIIPFEESHPMLEPTIKCLLRTYSGIYDNPVSINEWQIAKLTRVSRQDVLNKLTQLHALGVIEYKPQKETPQVKFLTNRAPAEFLIIDHERYLKRKKEWVKRVKAMVDFIQLSAGCRSVYIANYFDDTSAKNCGVCDTCLSKKRFDITRKEFAAIKDALCEHLKENKTNRAEIFLHLKMYNKVKVSKVLDYLQSERKIIIEENGLVHLKNGE